MFASSHYSLILTFCGWLVSRADEDDPEFRLFKKQLYHASLTNIFEPLKDAMSKPVLTKCFDGYYRDVIYGIGPILADYPEQVYLAGVVQGWCPKYVSRLLILLSELSFNGCVIGVLLSRKS